MFKIGTNELVEFMSGEGDCTEQKYIQFFLLSVCAAGLPSFLLLSFLSCGICRCGQRRHYLDQARVSSWYSYASVLVLVKLLPGGWTNQARILKTSAVVRDCIFLKSAKMVNLCQSSKFLTTCRCCSKTFRAAQISTCQAALLSLLRLCHPPLSTPPGSLKFATKEKLIHIALAHTWYFYNATHLLLSGAEVFKQGGKTI